MSVPRGYSLRPAAAVDLPKLSVVEVAAGAMFQQLGMDEIADDEGPSLEVLDTARAEGRLWVVDHDDEPAGYVLALLLDGQAHLEQLSVHPDHGRRGLGTALVGAVVEWAEGIGAPNLTLSTFRDVAWNGPYYQRLGFEVVADDDLSPVLRDVRAHEADEGLDIDARSVMRLLLVPSSGQPG